MQVPEHLVSLYVATCGQNGNGLGSDEKEIILLVYVILEAKTGQIIGTKQILVRPDGSFVKDRAISISSDTSNTGPLLASSSPPPPTLAITYNLDGNGNNTSLNNSVSSTNSSISNGGLNLSNASTASITSVNNNLNISNNNNNNSNNTTTNSNGSNSTTTPTTAATMTTMTTDIIELPIAVAQAAGKPLGEALEEFDVYLRSLALNVTADFKIITDGQLPLRQCIHREACAKDIELPAYYNEFSDLRKEFLKYKSGDLSRALVPMKDIKKILQMPTAPGPQSISEMMTELNLSSTEETEFYVRESRDMVSVIQTLLKAGHIFAATETVTLILEPGICSIDDEIDGNCIVRARGLPWQSSDQDIAKFFRGLNVAKGGVALCLSPLGRRNGEALIRFVSQEHRDMALKRHKHHIGNRYIEVYRATGEDFLSIAGGASNEAQAFLSKGAQVIIRMRGLPYDCSAKQVLDFFTNGESPCNVLDGTEGVLFVKKPDGRATGDAFVLFANECDAPKALKRHRESIGQRYIELFRSTTAEVQQVLNRSMDPKTYEAIHPPPLIAQLPTVQLPMLPQHLITSGTTKNCIRLRGLPYEALVEHILHFLDDYAKHIIYQGVHMVINAQGQPSGEAFIQMDTEESARQCAQRKHNQFMVFGKKYRYIEVFQCSGDDMNMVLNGGLQTPLTHHAGGKQAALLSPGASVIGTPFGHFAHFVPPTPILAAPHRAAHHPHAHAATFYAHPLVYWPYPSPPVSPTTYYTQPTHAAASHAAAAQHQAIYSLDFMPATNYAQQQQQQQQQQQPAALSPPNVVIPTTQAAAAAALILSPNKTQTMTLVPPKQFSAPITNVAHAPLAYATNNPIALQQTQQQQQQQQAQQQPNNNLYSYVTAETVESVTAPVTVMNTPTQSLLSIDTTLGKQLKQSIVTNAAATNVYAAVNGSNSSSTTSTQLQLGMPTPTTNVNGPTNQIVPNHGVELYIS